MNKEEKELLIKDLCARLPYGVICKISYTFNNETTDWEDVKSTCDDIVTQININTKEVFSNWLSEYSSVENVKPYLRPMSSMTEDEVEQFEFISVQFLDNAEREEVWDLVIDWLNAHHFDHRHLIEKGLAIAVTKENNPYTLA